LVTKRYLVAANWKMNGSREQADVLVRTLVDAGIAAINADIALCPASPYLAQVAQALAGTPLALGGQNLHMDDCGAHTGEVSGAMLKDVGCRYVIVGHSERRCGGETDVDVAQRVAAALRNGLIPILCVGESAQERDAGKWCEVLERQLGSVVDHCGIAAFGELVLAYEPVWAIGTGNTATPEQAQEAHAAIGRYLMEAGLEAAHLPRVLYGGSVNAANAQGLFAMPAIDGALVGGASLVAQEFVAICRAAAISAGQ